MSGGNLLRYTGKNERHNFLSRGLNAALIGWSNEAETHQRVNKRSDDHSSRLLAACVLLWPIIDMLMILFPLWCSVIYSALMSRCCVYRKSPCLRPLQRILGSSLNEPSGPRPKDLEGPWTGASVWIDFKVNVSCWKVDKTTTGIESLQLLVDLCSVCAAFHLPVVVTVSLCSYFFSVALR